MSPRRRSLIACRLVWLLVALISTSACSRARDGNPPVAPPPPPAGGTIDPAFDWERVPPDNGRRPREAVLTFQSSRSLPQTTPWLVWAISQYGHFPEPDGRTDVSDVRFRGCTLEWTERQLLSGKVRESRYSIPLSMLNLQHTTPLVSSLGVGLHLLREAEIDRRYLEDGKETARRVERENHVLLTLREEDRIPDRVMWAIVHAARLCGADIRM